MKKNKLVRSYLRILRKDHKYTCAQMAALVGLSCRQHYERYETGERDFITEETTIRYFEMFSKIFSMPVSFFFTAERDYQNAKKRLEIIRKSKKNCSYEILDDSF